MQNYTFFPNRQAMVQKNFFSSPLRTTLYLFTDSHQLLSIPDNYYRFMLISMPFPDNITGNYRTNISTQEDSK